MDSGKIILTAVFFFGALTPVAYGGEKADLTVSRESQIASGIISRALSLSFHRREIKAFGEVVDPGNLIQLMNSYATARALTRKSVLQLGLSRNSYIRAVRLFKSKKLISLEQLQGAEAAYKSDVADSEAAFRNLSGLRGEIIQQWGKIIAGWITCNTRAAVDLVDRRLTLIAITIPQSRRQILPPGVAGIRTLDGKFVKARLVSASPVTDPAIQGMSYFYRTSPTPSLPVGTNVTALLPIGKMEKGVVVPASAVVWLNGRTWVFLKSGSDDFIRKEIATDNPVGGGWFVQDEIVSGHEIVVKGAQLLLSQEMKREVHADND